MTSNLIAKRNSLKPLKGHRLPDLGLIVDSNRQPDSQHIPISQRQTIITVEQSHCRWPIGDPQKSGFFLCGDKTDVKESYCPRHIQIAYRT
jgi:hypothetical protein